MRNKALKKLTTSAVLLVVALFLPFLTGQIPEIGGMLAPMHIPVLICGFVCGWKYGAMVGFIAPLLRSLFFGMPPIYPTALAMAFELLAYGLLAGLLYKLLPKKYGYVYVSLIGAMLGGRIVWGLARTVMTLFDGTAFTIEMFLAAGFVQAIPGIILHIVVIPPIVYALGKAHLIENE